MALVSNVTLLTFDISEAFGQHTNQFAELKPSHNPNFLLWGLECPLFIYYWVWTHALAHSYECPRFVRTKVGHASFTCVAPTWTHAGHFFDVFIEIVSRAASQLSDTFICHPHCSVTVTVSKYGVIMIRLRMKTCNVNRNTKISKISARMDNGRSVSDTSQTASQQASNRQTKLKENFKIK